MDRPLVSVIIPTFNRHRYLCQAVTAVLNQTYEPWELVIVDDGSTDGTRAWLESLRDERVRPLWGERTGNPARARNAGARAARGSLLAFLDSDDFWLPEKLVRQVAALQARPECGWSYVGRTCVDEAGREVRTGQPAWRPHQGWILPEVLASRVFIATSGAMVRRSLFEAIGGFDETLARCQDVDLWIRLAEQSPAVAVPDLLVQKRLHSEDRATRQLDVQRYMNRIYRGALARTGSSAIRRLCRRRLRQVNLEIASGLRGTGQYGDAYRALWHAFRYAGGHPRWWIALVKTVLRPLLSRSPLPASRRFRAGAT